MLSAGVVGPRCVGEDIAHPGQRAERLKAPKNGLGTIRFILMDDWQMQGAGCPSAPPAGLVEERLSRKDVYSHPGQVAERLNALRLSESGLSFACFADAGGCRPLQPPPELSDHATSAKISLIRDRWQSG